ncbi:MAG: hypothetical protein V1793_03535 [Pseudomonadota bacterium]
MNSDQSLSSQTSELMAFVSRFLEENDAAMETGSHGLEVLLPSQLAKSMDVPEHITLVPGADAIVGNQGSPRRYFIHLGAPFLEGVTRLATEKPPLVHTILTFHYMKQQGFDALVQDQFEFYKAKVMGTSFAEIKTRYVLLTLKFTAQSDEQKEGLVDLAFNLETGALVSGMLPLMPSLEKQYATSAGRIINDSDIPRIDMWINRYAPDAIDRQIAEFKKSMNRRYARDSRSLDEYYAALKLEMEESMTRAGISERLLNERQQKIALIPEELNAKKADLLNRYSIRVGISLAAAMVVTTPAVKIIARLASGNRKTDIYMIYNPILKAMDPMVCPSCGLGMRALGLCSGMHPVCPDCLEKRCRVCG